MIGLIGLVFGVVLGYLVAALIISPDGMMGTYLDMPVWDLVMPGFCVPVMVLMMLFLTLISYLSVKKMLKGTAADALRPYTPKAMKKSVIEKLPFWNKLPFGTKWNFRDLPIGTPLFLIYFYPTTNRFFVNKPLPIYLPVWYNGNNLKYWEVFL